MAIGATCIWEVRTTGSNTNGGGYTSGGTNYSQQNAAQYALTGVTSAGAGNTVLTASAAADMIGNIGCCVSGTNFTTSEFFEVASVSAGVSITFGTSHAAASICTGIGASGVINIGGAFLIGGALDDEWFDSIQAGNKVWIQTSAGGVTYTVGEIVTAATAGTVLLPIVYEAYITARGTKPTGVDRPIIACGGYAVTIQNFYILKYVVFTTATTEGFVPGNYNVLIECKSTNTSASPDLNAFGGGNVGIVFISCEGISKNGNAFVLEGSSCCMINCYAHDAKVGFLAEVNNNSVLHCLVDTCQTGINLVSVDYNMILNNTIRNCITGIAGTDSRSDIFLNNIVSDCITGAGWTTNELINFWDFNCFNNGTDNTNVTLGNSNLVATDPLLVSGLVSGTDGATSATGLVFTAASNPFSGVTTSDCLLIKVIGTGATLGVYVISSVDSNGQITLATGAGVSKTGITYGIVKGTNFTLGAGSPCFDAGLQPSSLIGIS